MPEVIAIALAVLSLPDGRLLLQRRDGGTSVSPHLLSCFGGHLEEGETPAEAMMRELEEETSLLAADCNLRPVSVIELPASLRPTNLLQVNIFSGSVGEAAAFGVQVFEGAGAEIYSIDALLARDDVAATTRAVINAVFGDR